MKMYVPNCPIKVKKGKRLWIWFNLGLIRSKFWPIPGRGSMLNRSGQSAMGLNSDIYNRILYRINNSLTLILTIGFAEVWILQALPRQKSKKTLHNFCYEGYCGPTGTRTSIRSLGNSRSIQLNYGANYKKNFCPRLCRNEQQSLEV